MFADFDLDSKYGTRALKRLYSSMDSNLSFQKDFSGAMPTALLPSRKTKDIMAEFVESMAREKDPLVKKLPDHDVSRCSLLLAVASDELAVVGLDSDGRKKPDVRVFLNRLAGLPVTRQNYVFSLFLSTLDDVITSAKSSGEFEGTAEDITATIIKIRKEIPLAVDPASGAQTKLEMLSLDRGISIETVAGMAVEAALKHAEKKRATLTDKDDTPEDARDEDSYWSSKSSKEDKIAPQGFYLSRNKIAGRHYILFARHKFPRSDFATRSEAVEFDPLGSMVIGRPNTGFAAEMNTQELKRKYNILLACDSIGPSDDVSTTNVELVRQSNPKVVDLWEDAFENSNNFSHQNGLAPRRGEVALITGPSLHILSALEKAVIHCGDKDRALKIMRAQVGDRRIVGVRFPADEKVIQQLQVAIGTLFNNRKNTDEAFVDEELSPVCEKSRQWATSERKTIKSFFAVKSDPTTRAQSTAPTPLTNGKKRNASKSAKTAPSNKKSKSITSFFKTVGKT